MNDDKALTEPAEPRGESTSLPGNPESPRGNPGPLRGNPGPLRGLGGLGLGGTEAAETPPAELPATGNHPATQEDRRAGRERGDARLSGWVRGLWFRSPLYQMQLGGRQVDHPLIVPSDPWPGNADRGRALLAGLYRFSGDSIHSEPPVWLPGGVSDAWLQGMHGFEWLRDLRAVGGDAARRHARRLVGDWLDRFEGWHDLAWRDDILAERIANWLSFHDFFCASAEDAFRARVMDSLHRQARHLAKRLPGQRRGAPLMLALRGLAYSGLALGDGDKRLALALRLLNREIVRQIRPDGGHVERNPALQLRVLRALIDLRTALRLGKQDVPEPLSGAIARMAPATRFFRLGDGGLAQFNDSGPGDPAIIDTVLAHAEARGKPADSLPETGFQRLALGRTTIIVDTGAAPPPGLDLNAHAGTLSMEMSVGRERMIVNCGRHAGPGPWRQTLKATAAHSTVTIDDIHSAEIRSDRHGRPAGLGRRVEAVSVERQQGDEAVLVAAEHDGYRAELELTHRRRLFLSANGEDLRGEDSISGPPGHSFAVRFHLHPDVQVSLVQNGRAALLRLKDGSGWRMRVGLDNIRLEESVWFGDESGDNSAPRRTTQIVLAGLTRDRETLIKWAFRREKKTG